MNEMLKCYAVYASDERGVECNEWKEVEVSYHQRSKMRGRACEVEAGSLAGPAFSI